jgi:hypothetical protein
LVVQIVTQECLPLQLVRPLVCIAHLDKCNIDIAKGRANPVNLVNLNQRTQSPDGKSVNAIYVNAGCTQRQQDKPPVQIVQWVHFKIKGGKQVVWIAPLASNKAVLGRYCVCSVRPGNSTMKSLLAHAKTAPPVIFKRPPGPWSAMLVK